MRTSFIRPLVPSTAARSVGLALAAFGLAAVSSIHAAPPTVTTLFPAGVPRGATTEVTVEGALDPWPVEVWTNTPGVTIAPGAKKGQLSVEVAEGVTPGVCLVRLFNQDGASPLKPLIIGHLPEILEQEPNDTLAKAQAIESTGLVVNGRFDKADDVDAFAVKLQAGQTLVASLESNFTLGRPADATLQVVDERGFVLAHNDDARGLDPQLAFSVPADGTYLVRAFCFPATPNTTIRYAGGPDYTYRLTITAGPYIDYTLPLAAASAEATPVQPRGWNLGDLPAIAIPPSSDADAAQASSPAGSVVAYQPGAAGTVMLSREPHPVIVEQEPNNTADKSQAVSWPVTVSGVIGEPGDVDVFRFTAAKGDNLSMSVESWKLGYELDVHLTLTDAAGAKLKEIDDTVRDQREAELVHRFADDGEYLLHVRDLYQHGGFRYPYRLRFAPAEPAFNLEVAADRFVLTPGKPLEIPITVNRLAGFNGEVQVQLAELPPGVKCAPAASAATGPTAKTVKLELTLEPDQTFQGPIRIVGQGAQATKPPADPAPQQTAVATSLVEGTTLRQGDLWLSTEPAKK